MSMIENVLLKGKNLLTSFGEFQFDENGHADIQDKDAFDALITLKGFFAVDGSQPTPSITKDISTPLESISGDEEASNEVEEVLEKKSEEELNEMSQSQLIAYAKEIGVSVKANQKKVDIIKAILA